MSKTETEPETEVEVETGSGERTLDDLPQPVYRGVVDIDELHVDGDNPNEMPDELFEYLQNRMLERGWIGGPILTDADGLIADGEHRWRAAKEIGLVEVEVKQWDVDDAGRRLIRQEANKIRGEHDSESDSSEFLQILETDHSAELEALVDRAEPDTDLDMILDEAESLEGEDMEAAFGDLPEGERDPIRTKSFTLSEEQVNTVDRAVERAKESGEFPDGPNDNSNGNALARICRKYLEVS